ncbi:FAD binding domain protein [Aspergillus ellipticus CBS 707.79]|uniref:FAD binding domain protein n=1 Tax=Aspergillus ellipticus CBS 707.79 TaxID=1448320 RepID=A0A319EGY8_9EURO|nr:FAD binding domain protein [Aspergillus ellipticus CBS 707.79]
MSPTPSKVLIIGAGPVGLMTALLLAQSSIRVTILEKQETLNQQTRAKLGFTGNGICWRKPLASDPDPKAQGEEAMKMGEIIACLPFADNEKVRDEHGNGVLYLPEPKLAELLYKAAVGTGLVEVIFGREACGIRQDDDVVTIAAAFREKEGKLETFRGEFLVGADGGKSATRKLLGIPFKGHSWPEHIVAIDVLLEDKYLDAKFPTSLVVHPVNFGLVTPLEPVREGEKTLYRCSIAVDPRDTRSDEELVSEEYLKRLLEMFAPGPRPLDAKVVNSSAYRTHQLCAATMRRGRCVLAGDAAHLNNVNVRPFGALGLTTGLLDAEALADTLAFIINDDNPLDVLDLYSDQRRKVFQTFVDPISSQNTLRVANDPETATEDWFLRAMIDRSPEFMAEMGQPYFYFWRTDMSKLVASKGYYSWK